VASPFGHSLVSCYFIRPYARATGRKELTLWSALFLMVLASLPDLDIFFGPHEFTASLLHRTITHSFFFAIWMGCVIGLIEALIVKGPLLKRALLYAAVIASHPAVDFFSVIPPYVGAMPLFWPFSWNYYLSPVALLPGALTYKSGIPVAESLLKTFSGEAVLIVPLLAFEGVRRWRAHWGPASRQAAASFARINEPGV
jgi:membrane-bound metal-dependent hydrolase YbcI (DUF457 family)